MAPRALGGPFLLDAPICEFLISSDTQVSGKPEKPVYIFCSVKKGDTEPLLVSIIYRPRGISFSKYSDVIDKLRDYCTCFSRKFILWDLNADLLKDGYEAQFVRNLSAELSLQVVQYGAKNHHTRSSHTWIDLILVDENDTVLDAHNIQANFHSTHNITLSLTWVKQPLDNTRPIEYRRNKYINPSELAEVLCACDWSSFTNSTRMDTDAALNCLCDILTRGIVEIAPIKTLEPKMNKLPWAGAELNRLQQKRDAAYRRYKRTRDKFFLEQFLSLR